jgi:hypothetical protein
MAYSEKHPSGAKAHVDFAAFTAVRAKALTYQSCPVTKPLYTKNEIALKIGFDQRQRLFAERHAAGLAGRK